MDLHNMLSAVKWVLLILLAGFIAQFGKRLADRLIEKRKKDKKTLSPPLSPDSHVRKGGENGAAATEGGFGESSPVQREGDLTDERADDVSKKTARVQLKKEKKAAKASEKLER